MPELPEVETVVRLHRDHLQGRTILRFESRWKKQVTPSAAHVSRELVRRRIERLHRRGKWIVADLVPAGHLLIHLRMSGRLEWHDRKMIAARTAEPPHVRAIFDLDDGSRLFFCDARKFGRIQLLKELGELNEELG